MSARLSDVERVRRAAAPFVAAHQPRTASPWPLLLILAVITVPSLLLVAHAVGWRNDVAALLVLAGVAIDRFILLRGAR